MQMGGRALQKEGTNEDMETRVRCGIKRTGKRTMERQRKEPWLLRPPPPGSLPAPWAVPELQWDGTDIPSLQSASYRRAGFHAGCLQGSHATTQKVDGALPPVCAEVGKCAELQNQSDPCHVLERQSSPEQSWDSRGPGLGDGSGDYGDTPGRTSGNQGSCLGRRYLHLSWGS